MSIPQTPDIYITGIGTAVPPYRLEQDEVFAKIQEAVQGEPDSIRWAKRIFKQCGVETRYTCEANLVAPVDQCRYLPIQARKSDVPTTADRMKVYKRESVPLGIQAAVQALSDADVHASEITHVITVSCTGQFLPGLDVALIRKLGIPERVTRIPLTFQGCAAGLKAVQLGRDIASANPLAQILIVCVELCTIHFQPSASREDLFGASFFGDGASACIISSSKTDRQGLFRLETGHSVLLPDSEDEMIWEVGNTGFDLYLSPNIPKLLGLYLEHEIKLLTEGEELPALWAIHPGGRGIVDTVQRMFELKDEQTQYSRDILKHMGNLSSATILFVFEQMRSRLLESKVPSASGVALAFGPGLTAELIKFTYQMATMEQSAPRSTAAVTHQQSWS